MKIGIFIPTLNASKHLEKCLLPLLQSPYAENYKILVYDSSSTDGTQDQLKKWKVPFRVVDPKFFDHGMTREEARKELGCEIVVYLTQDAYPFSDSIEKLVEPLRSGMADAAYGQQIPRAGSELLESFPREFSYPDQSMLKSFRDRMHLGLRVYMCSNSFAAYRSSALDKVGGFPKCIFGEDFLVAARLLQDGSSVAYVAQAKVEHSHVFRALGEFRRNFDIGVMHVLNPWLFEGLPKQDSSGGKFAKALLSRSLKKGPLAFAKAVMYLALRLFGYRLGRMYRWLPVRLAQKLSYNVNYWNRPKDSDTPHKFSKAA